MTEMAPDAPLETRVTRLESAVGQLGVAISDLKTLIQGVGTQVANVREPKWNIIVMVLGLSATLLASAGGAALAPLYQKAGDHERAIDRARDDRESIRERLVTLDQGYARAEERFRSFARTDREQKERFLAALDRVERKVGGDVRGVRLHLGTELVNMDRRLQNEMKLRDIIARAQAAGFVVGADIGEYQPVAPTNGGAPEP